VSIITSMKKLVNKFGLSWLFIFTVFIVYLFFIVINKRDFFFITDASWKFLKSIWWVFLVIYILMILVDLFVNRDIVIKLFKEKNSLLSILLSILGGIISTGPIYMWYPLLSELKDRGLKERYIVIFLYNRAIKIPLLALAIELLGLKLVLLLVTFMIVFSIINGYIVEYVLEFDASKRG